VRDDHALRRLTDQRLDLGPRLGSVAEA